MNDTQTADPIPLAPELASRVRAVADRHGLPAETALQRLVELALAEDEREFQETVAALRASLSSPDTDALPLDDWRTQNAAWFAAQRGRETA